MALSEGLKVLLDKRTKVNFGLLKEELLEYHHRGVSLVIHDPRHSSLFIPSGLSMSLTTESRLPRIG